MKTVFCTTLALTITLGAVTAIPVLADKTDTKNSETKSTATKSSETRKSSPSETKSSSNDHKELIVSTYKSPAPQNEDTRVTSSGSSTAPSSPSSSSGGPATARIVR